MPISYNIFTISAYYDNIELSYVIRVKHSYSRTANKRTANRVY